MPSALARGQRRLASSFTAVILVSSIGACGSGTSGSKTPTGSRSEATASATATDSAAAPGTERHGPKHLPLDEDNDYELHNSGYFDPDDYNTPFYPDAASSADSKAVANVVKRYLQAAARGDGATACSLMYSLFAETVPETYSIPLERSHAAHGETCAQIMSRMFKEHRRQLVTEAVSLKVAAVRTDGKRGLALLSFRNIPARSITVHLEYGAWKIATLLDTEVS